MAGIRNISQALLLLLILYIEKGFGISCYTCSSHNASDTNCQDPFNPAMSTYTENCKKPKAGHIGQFPANFCIKVIGKKVDDNTELVIRTCTLENMDNQCGVFRYEEDTLQGCILTCDYDGCNRAVQHIRSSSYWRTVYLSVLFVLLAASGMQL